MTTIRKGILVFCCFVLATLVQAQDLPLYSQYLLNSYWINPAIAASKETVTVRITHRQQWIGFKGAPSTPALTVLSPAGSRNAVALGLYNDLNGAINRLGFQVSFAHKVLLKKINNSNLSFGLSLGGYQQHLLRSNTISDNTNDVALQQALRPVYIPSSAVGVYFYNSRMYAGFSATNFLPVSIFTQIQNTNNYQKPLTVFLQSGIQFFVNKTIKLEPSLVLKANTLRQLSGDISLKMFAYEKYMVGLSYRTLATGQLLLGTRLKNWYWAYIFEYANSRIYNHSWGSHEIMIGYNFTKPKTEVPCPAY